MDAIIELFIIIFLFQIFYNTNILVSVALNETLLVILSDIEEFFDCYSLSLLSSLKYLHTILNFRLSEPQSY